VGFDWLMFDTEHAPVEVADLQPLLQAAAAGGSACVARPAWNDRVLIKRMLDVGAQTLLIPFVESAEQAAEAVRSTRYPPQGARGVAGSTRASRYGLAPDYLATANEEVCVLAQIETAAALDRLEQIAAVEGVDGVFIGPSDFAASIGHLGNPAAPEVQDALREAAMRVHAAGKAAGILATSPEAANRYLDWGYSFVAAGVDVGLLVGAARRLLEAVGPEKRDSSAPAGP
jgi:4-hydroxy-2-oxoheptanedioate aldolase